MKLTKLLPILALPLMVFMAGCNEKDDDPGIRPVITSTNPITNSIDAAVNTHITAAFSVAMDPASINNTTFTLQKAGVSVDGTTSYTGMTASFIPTADLSPNTLYTATVTKAVKSTTGKNLVQDYTWTFTTDSKSDLIAPMVTLVDPTNEAVGIALAQSINVTFSEPMDASTVTAFTMAVRQGTTSVTGVVTYGGSIATFTPTNDLLANKEYFVIITTSAKDIAGNALAAAFNSSFTTGDAPDVVAPTVTTTEPSNNAIGVSTNKVISIEFSEAMTAASINANTFTVTQGGNAVAGTVAYSGTTATFTPTTPFTSNTVYTATITTGAKDLAGNALAATLVWSFTTGGGQANNLAPVNLGAAGNYIILAKTAISNIPTSAITGDVGLSPAATSFITGFSITNATGYATSTQVTGKIFAADMASPTPINLTTAVENMITAYNDAAGRPTPDFSELATGNIGGSTLTPGLYKWTNTVTIPSDITISGGSDDVWIFQIAGDLTQSNAVNVTLTGGAQAKNIFWQVAGTVTIGTTSHFEGIILSQTGITLQTGATLNGRTLAQTAVILDKNTLTKPN
jgi:hypothetical protein